jgi:hypothetical protein
MNEIIIGKLNRIEAKLDALIKALHEYDGNDEYGESSFEAFMDTKTGPCSKHDEASWDEDEAERRMDIIGQNGNEGLHYATNEEADEDAFDDYGARIVTDSSFEWEDDNTQDKHVSEDKDKRTGVNKKKYYNKYSKTKQSKVDNQKYIKTNNNRANAQ